MILYFSSTGNSRHVALALARRLADTAVSITEVMDGATSLDPTTLQQPLGLVFPVHGWSIPNILRDFIISHKQLFCESDYLYALMTCGDDVGMADRRLNKYLRPCGRKADACFSVFMPNTYVCLPGFDVDKPRVVERKLAAVDSRLDQIAQAVASRQRTTDLHRGALPYTKTYILGGLFRTFLITDKPFRTTSACTRCQRCARVCPLHNITVTKDSAPQWHHRCTGCLACYHHCPQHALHYANQPQGKGQWTYKIDSSDSST